MNCLETRRALSVDPCRLSTQAQSHIARCQECQSYRNTVLRMDAQVTQVLRKPKRAGLRERLLLAHSARSKRWRVSTAAAAVVLVGVVALVLRLDLTSEAAANRLSLMTEHLLKDPIHELVSDPEADIRLRSALAQIGVVERELLPGLRRAGICVLNGELAVHLVFEVEGETVVAFVLAHSATAGQIYQAGWQIYQAGWTGEVRTVNGGSFGVFTRGGAATLAAAQRQLEKGLSWKSA